MLEGGCHCGALRYRAAQPLALINCHCRQCRQINGGAFSSYVIVAQDGLNIEGDTVGTHQANPRAVKHFCRQCGTPTHNTNPATYPGLAMLYLGSLDDDLDMPPTSNIFCSSKLAWVDGIAGQPGFDEAPPVSA